MLWTVTDAVAMRGTCSRLQVGAVASKDGRILLTGYNGAPAGMPHCEHDCDCGYPGEGGLLFAGKHLSDCASIQPCKIAVHAEANLIAYAARYGVELDGARLDCTDSPCLPCAQLMINAGFTEICFDRAYRDRSGELLLIQAGIKVFSRPGSLVI